VSEEEKISEVVYLTGDVLTVSVADIQTLKDNCRRAPKRRARICAHPSAQDVIHEMLIAVSIESYIRPHRHNAKSESFHIIEGALQVILFDDTGMIDDVVHLESYGPNHPFYYRLNAEIFHTIIPQTEVVVIHETTKGPFIANETEFAAWSPHEGDAQAVALFIKDLRAKVASFTK
jgi:cupin fold WbuC family metalloprotein